MAKERSFKREYEATQDSKTTGKHYLFVIGIDNYSSAPLLKNAVRDAKGVAKVLLDLYQFEEADAYFLYDEVATHKSIIAFFGELAKNITENDNLLIYYAGHGFYDRYTKIGYWVPVDAIDKDYSTYINHSTIRDYIRAIPAHHTLLIVDSCFSGDLIKNQGRELTQTESYADKIGQFPSRWCLAAGMIEKVSDGYIGDHSPFAQSLITFLKKNKENKFPVQDLITHVCKATSYNSSQTPIAGVIINTDHQNGQFIFELKRNESRDWETAVTEDTIEGYKKYLSVYSNSIHSEDAYWRICCKKDTNFDYRNYLEAFPKGKYVNEALEKLPELANRKVNIEEITSPSKQNSSRRNLHRTLIFLLVLLPIIFVAVIVYKDLSKEGKTPGTTNLIQQKSIKITYKDIELDTFDTYVLYHSDELFNLIHVQGGTFFMGDSSGEGEDNERPMHQVTLNSFLIGKNEVTFLEYEVYISDVNKSGNDSISIPSHNGFGKEKRPVINVSWLDAIKYCNWLSKQHGYKAVYNLKDSVVSSVDWTANGYRLPTEAEWEYAAKGGKLSKGFKYSGSNNINDVAWHQFSVQNKQFLSTQPVGQKVGNELKISDMSGNVREWCWDIFSSSTYYYHSARPNPIGPEEQEGLKNRTTRGGSYFVHEYLCRTSHRNSLPPESRAPDLGFRICRSAL